MADAQALLKTLFRVSVPQLVIGIVMGLVSLLFYFLGYYISVGGGLILDPGEIPVTLAGALGGPVAGIIAGICQGAPYAPVRNLPSHILGGIFAGAWYYLAWTVSAGRSWPRFTRVAIWIAGIPIYYIVVIAPVYMAIYAANIQLPFLPMYQSFIGKIVPEIGLTLAASGVILALLPTRYARPFVLPDEPVPLAEPEADAEPED